MEYIKIKKVLKEVKEMREKDAAQAIKRAAVIEPCVGFVRLCDANGVYIMSVQGNLTERQQEKTTEEQKQILYKKALKEIEKNYIKALESVERAETVEPSPFIEICVDWKASRTWGHNPLAEVRTNKNVFYSSRVTGCGYDKRSTATAEALNQSSQVKATLYNALEKQPQKVIKNILCQHTKHYKADPNDTDYKSRHVFGYGVFAGFYSLPRFEGGVGFSCHRSVLERLGYKNTINREPSRGDDLYYFEYTTNKRG